MTDAVPPVTITRPPGEPMDEDSLDPVPIQLMPKLPTWCQADSDGKAACSTNCHTPYYHDFKDIITLSSITTQTILTASLILTMSGTSDNPMPILSHLGQSLL